MHPTHSEPTTYWVCEDCYVTHHYGKLDYQPDREPLSLLPAGEVISGIMHYEHHDECPNRISCARDRAVYHHRPPVECDCERQVFSWANCDGCGSTLGGSREALTV